jgi:hypothetical protein
MGSGNGPKGMYRDRILRPGTAPEARGWRSNVIVDRCRLLLAGFMRGSDVKGVGFLAVGRGDPGWDALDPGHPAASVSALTDPSPAIVPVQAVDMAFLDFGGNVSATPTPRLQVTVTLAPGTPAPGGGETSYPLREFGLFGTFGAEAYMIDYVRHPVIHKAPGDTLVRTIRLVF